MHTPTPPGLSSSMTSSVSLFSIVLACGIVWVVRRFLFGGGNSALENIPGPPSQSWWKGNLNQFFGKQGWAFHRTVGEEYGPVVKMNGFMNQPTLYVFDPKAMQSIILKDQNVYGESREFILTNLVVFGPGLLGTLGDHHRKQRKLLNPVFSVSHLRYMLPIFYRVVDQLRDAIGSQVSTGPQEVDVLNWMGRTALELVGQGGLGYSFDPLIEDKPNALGDALKALLPSLSVLRLSQGAFVYFSSIGSPGFRRRVVDIIPHEGIQRLKSIVDMIWGASSTIFEAKKSAMQEGEETVLRQVGEGKDIMSILMKANMEAEEGDQLPEHELIAQMSTLIFAATDTTSNALSRILHVLAEHQDVQERLRQEIIGARDGRDLSYDELMQLPFLDAVCRETLRLHPPILSLRRVALKDVVLPLSEPIRGRDGKMMHEIPIPKNTQIEVGILGSNRNKAIWGKDAYEWKPERWLSPLPQSVVDAHIPGLYSNLMTFLGGGRGCIGFKFSELEMKAVLCTLLPSLVFELPKEAIVWNISGVNHPTMGSGSRPQMLLKVTALKSGSI
ncbi:cytochrome P450 monooxygenase [Amylocystis lapponica]|nr:cytochrome P450 monooxygenase [Amylocystis lapponica]